MPDLVPQLFNIHRNKFVDFAAAVDGVPVKNLDFTPDSSAVGIQAPDENPADNNVRLDTRDVEIGATAQLDLKADGEDGSKRGAILILTVVDDEVILEPMVITMTELDA